MSHRDAVVEGRERPCKGRRRVALHDHPIGPKGIDDLTHAGQYGAGQIGEILIWPHQIEIPFRPQLEQVEDLAQHLAVLSGDAHLAVETRPARQFQENRRELDGLRPRPENKQ